MSTLFKLHMYTLFCVSFINQECYGNFKTNYHKVGISHIVTGVEFEGKFVILLINNLNLISFVDWEVQC